MNVTKYTPCCNSTEWNGDNRTIDLSEMAAIPLIETVIIIILLGCVIVFTIFGNTTVLLAVYLDRRLRHKTNYFIVNLAVADLLLGVTVLPLSATLEVLKYWPFGEILCELWASADVLWCTASILTLCVISIDRYIGVTRPLQHSSIITNRRAAVILAFVWILSGVISVGPLIGWRESDDNKMNECTVTKQIGYVIFSVSGSFYLPSLIIIVVYIKIYHEASKHSKFLSSGSKTIKVGEDDGMILRIHTARCSQPAVPPYIGSSSSENSEGSLRKMSSRLTPAGKLAKFKRETKAAKTLGIVVGVFICCWFPFFLCLPLAKNHTAPMIAGNSESGPAPRGFFMNSHFHGNVTFNFNSSKTATQQLSQQVINSSPKAGLLDETSGISPPRKYKRIRCISDSDGD